MNQIRHPYQGNNYFNAARANGLSFWESAGVTAFGSGTWEYFGETNSASLNDLINTTLGGVALGEMLHRTAWLVRDTHATERRRLLRELAATAIDPLTGFNRILSGDASRDADTPTAMAAAINGYASAGVLWRGETDDITVWHTKPFLELDVVYGDQAQARSRTPYDAFGVRLRLGGGGVISEARVRGRLFGQPLRAGRVRWEVTQGFDFASNSAFEFGGQSLLTSVSVARRLPGVFGVRLSGMGGVTVLAAVDSLPLPGNGPLPPVEQEPVRKGESVGPHFYDYGPGFQWGGSAIFSCSGYVFAVASYDAQHLYTMDGVRANHLLQQARIDVTAPLRGGLGVGTSLEYFDRRTFHDSAGVATQRFHFPQVRAYLTARLP